MQYKTVTVEHKTRCKRKEQLPIGEEYQEIINQHAAQGWILLGIHPIQLRRSLGCWKAMFSNWFAVAAGEPHQADILIFFREGDASEYIEPDTPEKKKKAGEAMKKAGSAVAGVTKNAMNFMKSEETANKLSSLKNKAMSSVSGFMNNSGSDDDSDAPQG